jgi:hypothetical protein
MQTNLLAKTTVNEVIALFSDSAASFELSPGATFADLADRVNRLGENRNGLPVAIFMKFEASRQSTAS